MTPRQRYEAIARNVLKIAKADAPEGTIDSYLQSENLNYNQLKTALKATDDELDFSDITGQAGEFFKGIIPGAAGTFETAAVGASALADDEGFVTEKGIRDTASSVLKPFKEFAAPEAGFEESAGRKIGEGIGSFLSFVGLGLIPGLGKAGLAGFATATGAGEARLRAEAENATPEQIRESTQLGSLVGVTEMFAPAKVLGRIKRTKKGATAVNEAVDRISSVAITGGIEGAQEAAAGIAQNFIAQDIYKPEQELVEGLGENFTVGATVGVISQLLFDLAVPRSKKIDSKKPTEDKPAETTEETTEPQKMPTKQKELFSDKKATKKEDLSQEEQDIFAAKKEDDKDILKETKLQESRQEASRLRDELDIYERADDTPENIKIKKELTEKIKKVERGLPKDLKGRPTAPKEQTSLFDESIAKDQEKKYGYTDQFTGDVIADRRGPAKTTSPIGAPLVKEAEGLSSEQADLFNEYREKTLKDKIRSKEVLSAEEMLQKRELKEEEDAKQIDLVKPKEARRPPFTLTGEISPDRLEGPEKELPPPTIKGATVLRGLGLLSEADFKKMGIGPTNKRLRKELLGKDLDDPKERDQVREVLTDFVQGKDENSKIGNNVKAYIETIQPGEQLSLGLPEPAVTPVTPKKEVIPTPEKEVSKNSNVLKAIAKVKPKVKPKAKAKTKVKEETDTKTDTPEMYGEKKFTTSDVIKFLEKKNNKEVKQFKKRTIKASKPRTTTKLEKPTPKDALVIDPGTVTKFKGPRQSKINVIEQLVKDLTEGWKNAPPIKVVENEKALPLKIQEELKSRRNDGFLEKGESVKGIFNGVDDTVYLIADAQTTPVSKRDVAKTILHESIGHYGLRAVLGGKYSETMQGIYDGNKEIQKLADTMAATEGLSITEAVEELIADSAELLVDNPKGLNLIPALKKLVKNVIKIIKETISKITGSPALSNKEVQNLLAKSAQFVIDGKIKRAKGKVNASPIMLQSSAVAANERMQMDSFLGKNVSNKQPSKSVIEKITAPIFDSEARNKAIGRLRNNVEFQGVTAEQKIKRLFGNKVRDALDAIRPDMLMTAALNADTMSMQVAKLGKFIFKKASGWEAVKGEASLFSMQNKIADFGVELGSAEKAMALVNDVLLVKRYSEIKNTRIKELIGEPDAKTMKEGLALFERYPQIQKILEDFTAYKNGLIDAMVEGGVLSKEKAAEWKEAAGYVPFTRLKEKEIAEFGTDPVKFLSSKIKSDTNPIKGSKDLEIGNIIENMTGMTFWMVGTTMRNHANIKLVDLFVKKEKDGGLNDKKDGQPGTSGAEKLGGFPENASQEVKDRVVQINRNGKKEFYLFDDVLDVYAFEGLETVVNPLMTALTFISGMLRKGVTMAPNFALSQLVQDSGRAMMYSGTANPFRVASRVLNPASYASVRFGESVGRKDPVLEQLNNFGIAGAYDLVQGKEYKQLRTELGLDDSNVLIKAFNNTTGFFENFSLASDAQLRKAVFEQTLADTKSEKFPEGDLLQARYAAQEIINFKRQGRSKIVGVLRQIVPFLNAYIQGTSVLYRTMIGEGISNREKAAATRLFIKTGINIAVLSSIYTLLVSDDEEYQGQAEYVKDKNFIIPGTGVKLPVAPEVGFFFKVIPERTINYITSQATERPQDAEALRKALGIAAIEAFTGPNLTPQFAKPLIEIAFNYSFFKQAPIVSTYLGKKSEIEQFTSSTSEIAKSLASIGQYVNLGPIEIEHLIRGMTGIMGGSILDLANTMDPNRGSSNMYEMPFVKTFMYDKIPSLYKTQFYELRDDVDRAAADLKGYVDSNDVEKIIAFTQDNERVQLYNIKKTINYMERQLSYSRKLKQAIARDPNISPEEKMELRNRIDARDNEFIESINIPNIRKNILGR